LPAGLSEVWNRRNEASIKKCSWNLLPFLGHSTPFNRREKLIEPVEVALEHFIGEVPIWGPVEQVLTEKRLRRTYGVAVEILERPGSDRRRRHAVPLL
jgi:hypothetical protein